MCFTGLIKTASLPHSPSRGVSSQFDESPLGFRYRRRVSIISLTLASETAVAQRLLIVYQRERARTERKRARCRILIINYLFIF